MASIRKIGSIALALSAMGVTAVAAEIKVMSAGAVQSMVTVLGAEFERETGNKLNLNFNTVGSLRDRLKGGETADLVILSASAIEALEQTGMFMPGSRTDLGRTVTGVVVQEGAPVPDITTPEGFKQALLAARTVAYTDPKAGGSSGTFFAGLLERLGIADAVNKKAVLGKRGHDVAQSIADGRAEIGTTFISEILPVQGVKVVGPAAGRIAQRQYLYRRHPCGQRVARGRHGIAAQADQPRHPRALDRGRAGTGVQVTTLQGSVALPNYSWTGAENRHGPAKIRCPRRGGSRDRFDPLARRGGQGLRRAVAAEGKARRGRGQSLRLGRRADWR